MPLGSVAWPQNNDRYYKLDICGCDQIPGMGDCRAPDNVCPSECRLGREVPRQHCRWCNTSVRGLDTKLSFSKRFLHFCVGVDIMRCIKSVLCWEAHDSQQLSGMGSVCVIWRGHQFPYHSCSLCTVTYYGEFTLRHVRAKWCRLIWCHLLMPWILYCCRYAHVRDSSDSQSPSSAPFHAGWQTASPFLSSAPVRAKSLPSSCFP